MTAKTPYEPRRAPYEPATPRLALARELMRLAVLAVDEKRMKLEALSHRCYALDDTTFEDTFLDVVEAREALMR